jgi:uncharacterized membrane protein
VRRENIFKPIIRNEILHQDSNDNGVTIINFATSKYLVVMSKPFPQKHFHNYTITFPEGKTHNQTENMLMDERLHSSILDVRSFREADSDSDH